MDRSPRQHHTHATHLLMTCGCVLLAALCASACTSSEDVPRASTLTAEQFRKEALPAPTTPGTPDAPPTAADPADAPAKIKIQTPITSIPGVRRPEPEQMGQGLERVAVIVGTPEQPAAVKTPKDATLTPPGAPNGTPVIADVLVGQINGKPVFASEILDPLDGKMRADLKKITKPELWIREQALTLQSRLSDRVRNELVLGEARARLTPEERVGITTLLSRIQSFATAQSGGSLEQARADIQRRSGEASLDKFLANERDQILIQRVFQESVWPRVRVPWSAVERFYRERPERYNPPGEAVLRLVMVDAKSQAAVDAATAASAHEGTFLDLAKSDVNLFLRSKAGERRFSLATPPDQWQLISSPEVNAKAAQLAPGQAAGPISYLDGTRMIWVRREADDRPPSRSLEDAQIDIQRELQTIKNAEQLTEFFQTLLGGSSYTPIEQMQLDLLALATERHLGGDWAQRIRENAATRTVKPAAGTPAVIEPAPAQPAPPGGPAPK